MLNILSFNGKKTDAVIKSSQRKYVSVPETSSFCAHSVFINKNIRIRSENQDGSGHLKHTYFSFWPPLQNQNLAAMEKGCKNCYMEHCRGLQLPATLPHCILQIVSASCIYLAIMLQTSCIVQMSKDDVAFNLSSTLQLTTNLETIIAEIFENIQVIRNIKIIEVFLFNVKNRLETKASR